MKKIMNYMFLSCRKATELIEKKLLIGLNSKEKVQLVFHTGMCDACKKYSHQSEELDRMIKNHVENYDPDPTEPAANNHKLKEKIVSSIDD
jgi:hypothetical protein